MKKIKIVLVVTFYFQLSTFNLSAQSVGINATGARPDSSALLDLSSTNKGFLITRVDTVNIPSPAFGLMTLAPSDSCLYMFNGTIWVGMGGAGSNCSCNCSNLGSTTPVFPCGGSVIPIVEVTSTTGKIWMDRNLGASQVATSSTDRAAYGDLYQWGRCSDGHEKRTSGTTKTLSTKDTPGHGDFITPSATPYDWRNPQNNSLWQGVAGINNPCPSGYRLPTETEWTAEYGTWSSNNAAGAFVSPLKLTMGGIRLNGSGAPHLVGSIGYCWSSTFSGIQAKYLSFNNSVAHIGFAARALGVSVRCIKD